jgi:hypothetical protein
MQTITITRPDDWHLHLRDGAALAAVLPDTARRFAPRHRDAQPQAAGDHGGAGRSLPGQDSCRPSGRDEVHVPLDDAVPDRQYAGRQKSMR